MEDSTRILFNLFDQEVDISVSQIRQRLFSTYQSLPWTNEQRKQLEPILQEELNALIQGMLGVFTNVGGMLPEDVEGFRIIQADNNSDISTDEADYSDMWLDYQVERDS